MMRKILYPISQAFRQLRRNKAMAFASIFAITAMLLILGLFMMITINVNTAAESIKQDYNVIEVYLVDDLEMSDVESLVNEIDDIDNVATTEYRTKETAMKILKERWGDSGYLLDGLSHNPLPNSILVTTENVAKSDVVADKLSDMDGVEDIKYYKDTVNKLVKITNAMQIAALIIMIFLIFISVIIVSNTIKLTVFARSEEISIMKYVGATNWFIRAPFLCEGIIIGLISALVSAGVIAFIYERIIMVIGKDLLTVLSTPMVPTGFLTYNLVWIFIALGVSIGTWGSIISMRRFLDT